MDLQDNGYTVKCIKGNHEDMMINSEDREGEMKVCKAYGVNFSMIIFLLSLLL